MADSAARNAEAKESSGGRVVTALIAILIIIIWLVVFAFLVKLDVGGIGSNVLYPVLKDVPIVNRILPTPSEEQQATEGNYRYTTLKAANERIDELENELASATGATTANSDYISQLEAEVTRLQKYKDEYDAFEDRVAAFDEEVVFTDNAPDISEYKAYYEDIEPENAEKIYKQVLEALQYSARAEELGSRYADMDAASAAAILTEMSEDLDLVCDILENMSDSAAADIIQELDTTYAAQITKKLSSVGS